MNNAFVFYKDYLKSVNELEKYSPELVPELLKAIINYGIYEEYDESNPIINMAMVSIKQGIDNAHNRYDNAKENGKKGGASNRNLDYKAIYDMKVETGKTNKELAQIFDCSDRTISRALSDVRNNMGVYYKDLQDQDTTFNF